MSRRLIAGLVAAAAVAVFATTTLKADKPEGIMCSFGGGKKEIAILIPKGGTMGDAVQECLDKGGHPSGVFQGKGPVEPPKK